MRTYYFSLLALLFFVNPAFSQEVITKQELLDSEIESYFEQLNSYAMIYSGKDQKNLPGNIQSMYLREKGFIELDKWGDEKEFPSPIPEIETFANGDLLYDGIYYPNLTMRLDLCRDEISVLTPNKKYRIILDPKRVKYANFNGYHIIYLLADKEIAEGYYLELYSSDALTVLKRDKFEFSYNMTPHVFLSRSRTYYIKKEDKFYSIKNKNAALKVLKSHKNELERFIKEHNLRFKGFSMENDLVRLVTEHERLEKEGTL